MCFYNFFDILYYADILFPLYFIYWQHILLVMLTITTLLTMNVIKTKTQYIEAPNTEVVCHSSPIPWDYFKSRQRKNPKPLHFVVWQTQPTFFEKIVFYPCSAMCSVWETASITLILLCFNFDCLEDETLLIVCLLVWFLEESKDSVRATFVTESAGFIMYDFIISLLCFSWMPCNALLCDGRKAKKEETLHFTVLKMSHCFLELFRAVHVVLK